MTFKGKRMVKNNIGMTEKYKINLIIIVNSNKNTR